MLERWSCSFPELELNCKEAEQRGWEKQPGFLGHETNRWAKLTGHCRQCPGFFMLFPQVLPIPFHVHILNRQLITPVSYKKRGMNHSHKGIRLDCIFPLLLLKTPQASHPGILTLQGAEFTLLFLPITFLLGWQPVPPSCLSIHLFSTFSVPRTILGGSADTEEMWSLPAWRVV